VDPADFVGRSTAAQFDTAAGRVIFVIHKPSWRLPLEHERELQAVHAATFIENLVARRADHVVVAGDFDARPETASMRFWTGRQSLEETSVHYLDAWEHSHPDEPGHTFTTTNPLTVVEADWPKIPPRRIDYILIRCDDRGPTLRVDSCRRLFDQPVLLEEHRGFRKLRSAKRSTSVDASHARCRNRHPTAQPPRTRVYVHELRAADHPHPDADCRRSGAAADRCRG
jgi:hypothetical protein